MMLYSCSQMVGLPGRVSFEYQLELLFDSSFLSSFLFFFFGYKITSVMSGMGSSSRGGGGG